MKAVQSFWVHDKSLSQLHTITGGWIDARYHLMSWCLSCLLLKKHFDTVELVTDHDGKTILIDWLGLPYDTVSVALEPQKPAIKKMWVLGKLFTYAQQDEPFIHVDGDVFMWQKPDDSFLKAALVSQNFEVNFSLYSKCLEACKNQQIDLPTFIQPNPEDIRAANAGIIGGQNTAFFKELYEEVVQFLQKNQPSIETAKGVHDMPIILEQLAYYELAKHKNLTISTLRPDSYSGMLNNLADFINLYDESQPCTYIHLLGLYKHHLFYCKQMEVQLQMLFPEYHQRVIDLLDNGQWKFEEVLIGHEHDLNIPEISVLDHNIHKAVEKPFKRTNKLIELLHLPLPEVNQANIDEVAQKILPKVTTYPYNLLGASIDFEKRRYQKMLRAVAEAPALYNADMQRQHQFKRCFAKPVTQRLHDQMQVSTEALFTESAWSWINLCPSSEKYKPSYYVMHPIINHQTGYLQEIVHDDLGNFILNMAQNAISIAQLVEKFGQLHQTPLTPKAQERLLNKFDQRIKEMYLNGMIDYWSNTHNINELAAMEQYA